jgi:hypothetical protein
MMSKILTTLIVVFVVCMSCDHEIFVMTHYAKNLLLFFMTSMKRIIRWCTQRSQYDGKNYFAMSIKSTSSRLESGTTQNGDTIITILNLREKMRNLHFLVFCNVEISNIYYVVITWEVIYEVLFKLWNLGRWWKDMLQQKG